MGKVNTLTPAAHSLSTLKTTGAHVFCRLHHNAANEPCHWPRALMQLCNTSADTLSQGSGGRRIIGCDKSRVCYSALTIQNQGGIHGIDWYNERKSASYEPAARDKKDKMLHKGKVEREMGVSRMLRYIICLEKQHHQLTPREPLHLWKCNHIAFRQRNMEGMLHRHDSEDGAALSVHSTCLSLRNKVEIHSWRIPTVAVRSNNLTELCQYFEKAILI